MSQLDLTLYFPSLILIILFIFVLFVMLSYKINFLSFNKFLTLNHGSSGSDHINPELLNNSKKNYLILKSLLKI